MEKELLFTLSVANNGLEISFFSGSGAGGQHRNRHKNCVRLRHPASGAMATGQRQRSCEQNKRDAMKSLGKNKKFLAWIRLEAAKRTEWWRLTQEKIEDAVTETMREDNLRVEVYNAADKKWEIRGDSR